MSSRRLIPSTDFTKKYFEIIQQRRINVKAAIHEIENGQPPVNECPETGRRNITHSGCRLYFRNDALLDFEFV